MALIKRSFCDVCLGWFFFLVYIFFSVDRVTNIVKVWLFEQTVSSFFFFCFFFLRKEGKKQKQKKHPDWKSTKKKKIDDNNNNNNNKLSIVKFSSSGLCKARSCAASARSPGPRAAPERVHLSGRAALLRERNCCRKVGAEVPPLMAAR